VNVPPICASAAARRVRAFLKCQKLRTFVRWLVENPLRVRKWTWTSGTQRWVQRWEGAGNLGWLQKPCKEMSTSMATRVWHREKNRNPISKRAKWYTKYNLGASRVSGLRTEWDPALSTGMTWLSKVRIGGIWWAGRLAAHGLIDSVYVNMCPMCRRAVPETQEHVFLECSAWAAHRRFHLGGLVEEAQTVCRSTVSDNQDVEGEPINEIWVALLLGGEYHGRRIPSWTMTPSEGPAACFRIANFLSEIMGSRGPLIRDLRINTSQVPSTQSQRTDGVG